MGKNALVGGALPIVFFVLIMYLMIFLPESKRKKKFNSMIGSLKINDEIVTRGGIVGKIVIIQDENIIIQSGPDRIRLKVNKNAVSGVYNKKEETTEKVSYKENRTPDDTTSK